VIRMTARRASSTPQFELLLKLKQSSNNEFEFLCPHHSLHSYYLFLKKNGGVIPKSQEITTNIENLDTECQKKTQTQSSSMSTLLAMYSSSEDEHSSSEDEENEESQKLEVNALNIPCESDKSVKDNSSRDISDNALTNSEKKTQVGDDCHSKKGILTLDEKKARRLRRARIMKGHFTLKMMD